MNQFTQHMRDAADKVIGRVNSTFHHGAMKLFFWGLGSIAVLVPSAAYAWGNLNPVASSTPADGGNVRDTATKVEKTAPSKNNTNLDANINNSDSSAADTNDSQTASNANQNQANIQLHVNGQAVPVPSQGTVHKEISSDNGTTSVDLSVNSASSGTSQSNSHTSMNIEMNSSTETGGGDAN